MMRLGSAVILPRKCDILATGHVLSYTGCAAGKGARHSGRPLAQGLLFVAIGGTRAGPSPRRENRVCRRAFRLEPDCL